MYINPVGTNLFTLVTVRIAHAYVGAVLDGQDYATNMYMSEGWETFGVDKDFSKQYSFEL